MKDKAAGGGYGRRPISAEELATANRVKEAFRQFQRVQRLDTKHLFENWDRLNRRKVSPKQFRQVLATVGFALTEEESRCVCRLYASEDERESEVRYVSFLADTRPFDPPTPAEQEPRRGTGSRAAPASAEEILERLRFLTKTRQLRHREYFKDFDPLSRGVIHRSKFRGVLCEIMNIDLDEAACRNLEERYLAGEDIDYPAFCEDVEIVFNLPDRTKDPTNRPPAFDYSRRAVSSSEFMRLLAATIRGRRLDLKPFFQDSDRVRAGRVSFTRMRAILDNLRIPLSEQQFAHLCGLYSQDGEFDYHAFFRALD